MGNPIDAGAGLNLMAKRPKRRQSRDLSAAKHDRMGITGRLKDGRFALQSDLESCNRLTPRVLRAGFLALSLVAGSWLIGSVDAHGQSGISLSHGPAQLDLYSDEAYDIYRLQRDFDAYRDQYRLSTDPDWLHWWELHRYDYLPPSPRGAGGLPDASGAARIVTLLMSGLEDADPSIRWSSAISLGRMRITAASGRLIAATEDPVAAVAVASWTALGLLQTPESREALISVNPEEPLPPMLNAARLIGLGLLATPDAATNDAEVVQAIVDGLEAARTDEERRSALFALRAHTPDDAAGFAVAALQDHDGFGTADEAIAALAASDDDRFWSIAATLIRRRGRMDHLPMYERYLMGEVTPRRLDLEVTQPEAFGYVNAVRTRTVLGVMDRSPALRLIGSNPEATPEERERVRQLRNHLTEAVTDENYTPFNGRHWFFRGMPLLALGAIGDARDHDLLTQAYRGKLYFVPGLDRRSLLVDDQRQRLSLLQRERGRTYASLAMALMMREGTAADEAFTPTDSDRLHPALVEADLDRFFSRLMLSEEDPAFRCAAALAIGISRQPQARPRLVQAILELERSATAPRAFAALALMMLRESEHPSAADEAELLLRVAEAERDRILSGTNVSGNQVLAMRTLVQALGLLEDQRSGSMIRSFFGMDPHLDTMVIEVLADRGDLSLVSVLTDRAANAQNPGRPLDLLLIGMAFDPPRDSRAGSLMRHSNHTLPMVAPGIDFPSNGPVGPRPMGLIQRMTAPSYFEFFGGGSPHRPYTYR